MKQNNQTHVFPFFQEFDSMINDFFTEVVSAGSKKQVNYPYTNIYTEINKETNERKAVVEIAVAGFSKEEITIELNDKILLIKGTKNTKSDDKSENSNIQRIYSMQGLAQRNFERSIVVFENIEKIESRIINGILIIEILEKQIESKKTIIEIK